MTLATLLSIGSPWYSMFAQTAPCPEWCPGGTWQPDQTFIMDLGLAGGACVNCYAQITYRVRANPCGINDYYISKFEFVYPSSCPGCDLQSALSVAITALLAQTSGSYPFDPIPRGGCSTTFQVSAATCWTGLYIGTNLIEACSFPLNTCCWTQYKVCKDNDGYTIVTPLNSGPTTFISCDNQVDCLPICDALYHEPIVFPPQNQTKPNINPESNIGSDVHSIETSIVEGRANITIHVQVPVVGEITVEVSDSRGNLVKNETRQVTTTGEANIIVDKTSLASGRYVYRVTLNSETTTTGVFTIAK